MEKSKVIGGVSVATLAAILGIGYTTLEKADTRYTLKREFIHEVSDLRQGQSATNDRIDYAQIEDVMRRGEAVMQKIVERNKTPDRSKWTESDRDYASETESMLRKAERKLNLFDKRVLRTERD